ncbi:hypothetical protein [Streptomyces sp. MS2.AVA.5]|uniref:Uncharacterized protein n=1 Tax=Streptomyces achmelvichensis TaxID=3134111 RepID=A0ACC6PLS7_9ACTN
MFSRGGATNAASILLATSALFINLTSIAHAEAVKPGDTPVAIGEFPESPARVYLSAREGYTYEQAVEAFKDSKVIQVSRGEIPNASDKRVRRSTEDGWYVTVNLSEKEVRAIIWGGIGAAASALGVASVSAGTAIGGPAGAVAGALGASVAGGVASALASYLSDSVTCKHYEIKIGLGWSEVQCNP